MFPVIDKNMKQKDPVPLPTNQSFDKVVADNTTRMVEILQSVVRSNQNLNVKTDKLVAVSQHMVTISQNMAKISQQMMTLNEENIKWLKRLDKRMYYMNQSLAGQAGHANFETRDRRTPEKQLQMVISPLKKTESKVGNLMSHDERLKMFDEVPHHQLTLKKQSDLSKTTRLVIAFNSQHLNQETDPSIDVIKTELATWIGQLYRQVTSHIYDRYINSVYSQEEARLIYCQNLILNSLSMMKYFRETNKSFWNKYRNQLLNFISTCSRKILGFLKVKVPRNKKNFKSLQFENLVERINNSEDPRYDILKNSQIWFEVKDNKEIHYIREIKILFNTLIEKVEAEYPTYNKTMARIFNGGDTVNEKVKYLIGKKFKDNIPKFSQEELNTLSFKCKSPQILRILIKWLQQMEDMIKTPVQFIEKKKVFKNYKRQSKDPVPVSEKIKKDIVKQILKAAQKQKEKFSNVKDILSDLLDNVSQLVSIKPDSSEYLDHEDIKAIKFSQLISESLPFLAVTRIEMITEICRSLQTDNKSGLLEMVDLLTFSVFDLLRSKCIGSKAEIEKVYQRIREQKYLELIRVKNRLDTPLNDILINCRVKGSPLICQVQLLITNQLITQKSERNQHFNHFLYELQRSKFGPLCEACIIINDSDPRMQYIEQLKKIKMKMVSLTKEQQQNLDLVGPIKRCYNQHLLKTLHFSNPFICTICSVFYKQYSSTFDSYFCDECNLVICPSCFLDRIKETEKKDNYLLKEDFFRKVFYKENIYELKNYKDKKLGPLMTSILHQNNCKYCMIISYAQGVVTKKGYKLIGDSIFPTYFTLIKKPAKLDDWDKYDVLVLFKEDQIQKLPPKNLIRAGDVQFTNSAVNRQIVEDFATRQSCNLKCISDDNVILVIDFDESDEKIESVMREQELEKKIKECRTSKITTLNISSSALSDLDILKRQAKNLDHVLTVVADENNLTSLEPFWALNNIKKLSLKQNNIKDYEQINIKNPEFIDLFLGVNDFEQFPLVRAPKMTRISFKRNKITNVDKLANSQLPLLQQLGLAENKITKLPLMQLPAIKKIALAKNKISDIQILNQAGIKTVEQIDLEANKIETIPKLDLTALKNLNIGKNMISHIEKFVGSNLKSLQILILDNNKISNIPKQLVLVKLKTLDLSGNKISSLANFTKQQFPNLLQLNLSKNVLVAVPEFNFQLLSKLNLSNNQISKLTDTINGEASHFFDSNLPSITSLSLALTNQFLVKQLILMEMDRWFTTAKYLQ